MATEAAAVSLHGNERRKFLANRNGEHFRKGFGSHQTHLHALDQTHQKSYSFQFSIHNKGQKDGKLNRRLDYEKSFPQEP